MLTGADCWLRGRPSLPLQIYDWEDLCPVGLQAAQTYLADRQPCRFPPSGFMLGGCQLRRGSSLHLARPRFTLPLNFTFANSRVVLLRVALNLQPFYWERNYLCSGVEKRFYKEFHILSNFPSSQKIGDNGVEFLSDAIYGIIFYYIILKSAWFMGPGLKTWWS